VTLAVANEAASMPIMYQLYMPEPWASNRRRRRQAGASEEPGFLTELEIALQQSNKAYL